MLNWSFPQVEEEDYVETIIYATLCYFQTKDRKDNKISCQWNDLSDKAA